MAYHGTGGKARRKTAIYACKYHTGANPKEQPFDQMPKIGEEILQAEVLRLYNQFVRRKQRNIKKKNLETTLLEQQRDRLERLLQSITVYPDGKIKVRF